MTDNIDISQYRIWKADPVTKAVFAGIHNHRDVINDALLSGEVFMADTKRAIHSIGFRDGLDALLNIQSEEVVDEEHIDEN